MKKKLATLLLALSILLVGCVDKSQPWRDDAGHWHEHYVCRQVAYTSYTHIPVGRDRKGHTIYVSIPHQHYTTQCEYE